MNSYISEELVASLEEQVADAIRRIGAGEVTQATVALTMTVKQDEDGEILGEFAEKHTHTRKGAFNASPHPRLPLDDEPRFRR